METAQAGKIRENRLRAAAARQGYQLVKSRRRDPLAPDYGCWMIIDPDTNTMIAGAEVSGRPSMTLDQAEQWLINPASRSGKGSR
jgi:hypothetical protein